MRALFPLSFAAIGSLLGWLQPAPTIPLGHEGLCRMERAKGIEYVVCDVDLSHYDLRLLAEDGSGAPLKTFERARGFAEGEGGRLVLAMNAGMYHEDRHAVGLAIQDGRELKSVSTSDGPGNFSMKPNGIFFVEKGRAAVMETTRYLAGRHEPSLATQSGPMLLVDGQFHPRFIENSDSRYVRNGVCAVEDGRVVRLVLSRQPVNFWDFALFFRDTLGCRDALFFDGQVSSLYYPALGISYRRDALGPMLGVIERP